MELLYWVVISIAGLGAGVVTGLVGASAATVVTPMLVTFIGMDPYIAISISLATDVFASAMSSVTYAKHKNIELRNGLTMAIFAVLGAFAGSYLSSMMDSESLGGATAIVVLVMGFKFLRKKPEEGDQLQATSKSNKYLDFFRERKAVSSVLFGSIIGLICGVVGAGGGVMILIILANILGYSLKSAIGTSVLIMTFTAFSGAMGHFMHMDVIPFTEILVSGAFAIIGARGAALFANKAEESAMYRAVGTTFVSLGIVLVLSKRFLGI